MGYHFKKVYALSEEKLNEKIYHLTGDYFDKIIYRKRFFVCIAMVGWFDEKSKNRREISIIHG